MSDELQFAHYPFEDEGLPESWEITVLENVLENIRPGFASGQHNKDGEGIPHLRPMNISPSGSIDLSEVRYVQGDHSLRLQRGDVLFNNTNSPVWVGKTALIETDDDLAFSNHMTRLRISSAVDPMFIAKQLHFLCSQGYFRHHCKKHVNQASIATDFLSRCVPVRIPPAAEQRRIMAKIEALQERSQRAREALAEVGPLLEQFRQSVLAVAFRGDLTADWRAAHPNVEPASELLHRIRVERRRLWEQAELAKYEAKGQKPPKNWKDKYEEPEPVDESELIELPKDWCWTTLESVTDPVRVIQYGILKPGPDVPEGVPYVKVKHMVGDRINIAELQRTTPEIDAQYTRSRLARGDLLLSIRGTYGRLALVPNELEGANITQDSARIALLPGIHREFGAAIIRSPYIQKHFESIAKGVAVRGLNIRDIRPTAIPLPPEVEQMEIACRINQWQESIELLEEVARDAALQFDHLDQSILAKAFRGELVPQDPNDEPASALLARIREQRAQQAEAAKSPRKTTDMQRGDAMRKKSSGLPSPYRPLMEVLTTKGQPMPPQQLLAEAGYDDDSIEDFYFALREEITQGRIREHRLTESDVMLEAVKQ